MRIARHIRYLSLGTFEFLANADRDEFFFLEVNPRLQVEHTVTESIALVDLVKLQLEIAQGATLEETELRNVPSSVMQVPKLQSIQLRLTAENIQKDWTLSIGRVQAFSLPTGHGVRVDTHLNHRGTAVVGADYDSLLAKIILVGDSQKTLLSKCRRALEDTWVEGVKTNLDVLRAIVAHKDFEHGLCDTSWLERNMASLLTLGLGLSHGNTNRQQNASPSVDNDAQYLSSLPGSSNSAIMLRRGDAWALKLTSRSHGTTEETHHIKIARVTRNDFPSSLKADIEYSRPGSKQAHIFTVEATSSNASSAAIMAAGKHRRGDVSNPRHVVVPFPGKLVELSVEEGDEIMAGQVVCVVQQMKMELEIRSSRGGRVKWVTEAQDGEDIAEGTLAAELEDLRGEDQTRALL